MKTATARALRTPKADLLQAIQDAMETASTEPAPVRERVESKAAFQQREREYVARCGMVTFALPHGRAQVLGSRERLERFARSIKACQGFGPARKRAIGRDRESGRALQPASIELAHALFRNTDDAALAARLATLKQDAGDAMRAHWSGARDFGPDARVAMARKIEEVQRAMVARGLLDATDYDKVNAEPVQETGPDDATAPLFAAPIESAPPVQAAAAPIESAPPVLPNGWRLPEAGEFRRHWSAGAVRYVSPWRVIGKHDWCRVIYANRCTGYYWRRAENRDGNAWRADEQWPRYNDNDGMHAGCPVTLSAWWQRELREGEAILRARLEDEATLQAQAAAAAIESPPPVPPALAEYRRRRETVVPVLRRVRRLRAGLRDVDFTDRTRDFLQRVLERAERERNSGLLPLLAARAAWQGRQLENSGVQVPRAGRNRAVVDGGVPVQRPRARWDAAIGAWVPVQLSAGGAA